MELKAVVVAACLGLSLQLTLGVGFCNCEASDTDFVQLGARLTGDVYLKGSNDYKNGSTLLNTRFNVEFRAVVYVKSTEDVQEVIMFCKKHGLTPTLRSSGHDYIGRSSCKGSVSLNMRRMTTTNIRQTASGHVVDTEPGINMGELYQVMESAGFVMVGGSAHTVAPGGWTTGGGHSPMSRMFGLGVDNTVGFTLVTPDGSIIKLNNTGGTIKRPEQPEEAYSDAELFWAVRGGGGGTFGIVTSFTYTIHPAPADGFVQVVLTLPIKHKVHGNTGDKILNKFKQYLRYNLTANWGGYIINSAYVGPTEGGGYTTGVLTLALLHVGGYDKAKDAVEHIWTWPSEWMFYRVNRTFNTFWDYEKSINDETGYRIYIANRLLQDKDMLPSSNLENVMTSVVDTKEKTYGATLVCTVTLLGGNMRTFATNSSSVSPNFRNSLGSYSCGIGWIEEKDDAYFEYIMSEYSKKMDTLGEGVYLNEPNSNLPDWKTDYWGPISNYERLLTVKRRVDPDNVLWCHHCVGSDLVKDNLCRSAATFTTSDIQLIFTSMLVYYISNIQGG